jgi:hypothetical protein
MPCDCSCVEQMHQSIRLMGRLLDATYRPAPPVLICVNKSVTCLVFVQGWLSHRIVNICAPPLQDAPYHLSCSHAAVFARCWLPQHVIWCTQDAVASRGTCVPECFRWLCRVSVDMDLQQSPRARLHPDVCVALMIRLHNDYYEDIGRVVMLPACRHTFSRDPLLDF